MLIKKKKQIIIAVMAINYSHNSKQQQIEEQRAHSAQGNKSLYFNYNPPIKRNIPVNNYHFHKPSIKQLYPFNKNQLSKCPPDTSYSFVMSHRDKCDNNLMAMSSRIHDNDIINTDNGAVIHSYLNHSNYSQTTQIKSKGYCFKKPRINISLSPIDKSILKKKLSRTTRHTSGMNSSNGIGDHYDKKNGGDTNKYYAKKCESYRNNSWNVNDRNSGEFDKKGKSVPIRNIRSSKEKSMSSNNNNDSGRSNSKGMSWKNKIFKTVEKYVDKTYRSKTSTNSLQLKSHSKQLSFPNQLSIMKIQAQTGKTIGYKGTVQSTGNIMNRHSPDKAIIDMVLKSNLIASKNKQKNDITEEIEITHNHPSRLFNKKGNIKSNHRNNISNIKTINPKKDQLNNSYNSYTNIHNQNKTSEKRQNNTIKKINDISPITANKSVVISGKEIKEEDEELTEQTIQKEIRVRSKEKQSLHLVLESAKRPRVEKTIKIIHESSKAGLNEEGKIKTNQDCNFIYHDFCDNTKSIFMGVCDGHGTVGHEVSAYIKRYLPRKLNDALKHSKKDIETDNLHNIISEVFIDLNITLSNDDKINSFFSGTTCTSLIHTPSKAITANVGDSRIICGIQLCSDEWVARELTRDHKPNLPDESKRILHKEGRIEPSRDEDNNYIGPHRVWLAHKQCPGLAMSRSFGDRVVHTVGVIPDPEIFEYEYEKEAKFLVLGSDGLYEYLSNEEIVDIVKIYYLNGNIIAGSNHLYTLATERWLSEEGGIDDITIVLVFFEN